VFVQKKLAIMSGPLMPCSEKNANINFFALNFNIEKVYLQYFVSKSEKVCFGSMPPFPHKTLLHKNLC